MWLRLVDVPAALARRSYAAEGELSFAVRDSFCLWNEGTFRMVTERVLVMYLGAVVEAGPSGAIFERPAHPYTQALLSAVPVLDVRARRARHRLSGEARSPIDPSPTVCRLFGRCPEGFARCEREMPVLAPVGIEHAAACHLRASAVA